MQATVQEALWFSCRLRFTNDVSNETAKAFVDEVWIYQSYPPLNPLVIGLPASIEILYLK